MPKKLKLNLKDLKVQSFVTNLGNEEKRKIMGGDTPYTCTELNSCNCTVDCTVTCGPTCIDCPTDLVMACDPFTMPEGCV